MASRKAEALIAGATATRREALELARLRAENKALLAALETADKRADLVDSMRATTRKPRAITAPRKSHGKRTATAVVLCSDWHVEERVDARTTNGRNEYNPDIAAGRARRLADAVCWMIQHHRTSFDIADVVLWLGGDLITGFIHEELREGNFLSPTQASLLVQDLAGNIIDRVLSLPGVKSLRVPTSQGNHGRTTVKTHVSNGAANSFEWLLYQNMRRAYANEKRVEFHIADGEFNYLDIYGKTLRFTHGDSTKFGGGIGGMTIPIHKSIARWQTYKHADVTCLGHYHQYLDTPGLVVNGSLIGAAPYGMRVGSFETPAQAFFLMDAQRGKCQSTPLWCAASDEACK